MPSSYIFPSQLMGWLWPHLYSVTLYLLPHILNLSWTCDLFWQVE